MALRFVAGESQNDAVAAIRILNDQGINATVDFLGENVSSSLEARKAVEEVLSMLIKLQQNELCANISVKLSQMGLEIDPQLCQTNMQQILSAARQHNNFNRFDMEDSSLTQSTIEIYNWLRERHFDNVGIVIQSYLFRSEKDLVDLMEYGTRVRLCKGAYKEPREIAFSKKAQVDENFDRLTLMLFRNAQGQNYPLIS